MLTKEQAECIRASAERLSEANIAATTTFYEELFTVAPEMRQLFPGDMFAQSRKLWDSIVVVVESAYDLSRIEAEFRALGARHADYGVRPEYYPTVTRVLIDTVAALMRKEWTPAHQVAWEGALQAVTELMMAGAAEYEAAPSRRA